MVYISAFQLISLIFLITASDLIDVVAMILAKLGILMIIGLVIRLSIEPQRGSERFVGALMTNFKPPYSSHTL
jgi:branched-subunit amino acid permease